MTPPSDHRTRILQAATELLSARSYHTVSMDEIAKLAGVSKGGLFHHFSSKYELASQVVLAALAEPWSGLVAEAQRESDPAQRVRILIGHLVDMALGNRSLSRLTLDILAEAMANGDGAETWMPILYEIGQSMESALTACGVPNPQLKATLLIATVDDLGIQMAFVGSTQGMDSEALKLELFELFVGNYLKEGE